MRIRTNQFPVVDTVAGSDTVQGIVAGADAQIPIAQVLGRAAVQHASVVPADAHNDVLTAPTVQGQLDQAEAALADLTALVAVLAARVEALEA